MKYIIDPYETEFLYNFQNTKFINGVEVATIDDVFHGTKKVRSDTFSIDGKYIRPLWYENNAYYETKNRDEVSIKVDVDSRMDLAEDVVSNAIIRLIAKSTFASDSTFDIRDKNLVILDQKDISYTDFEKLEILANQVIRSNLNIERSENFLKINGIGKVYFEGPILKRTSEVSIIKLKMPERTKDGIVIEVLAGRSAFLDYKKKSKLIENMVLTFRTDEESLFKKLKSMAASKGHFIKDTSDINSSPPKKAEIVYENQDLRLYKNILKEDEDEDDEIDFRLIKSKKFEKEISINPKDELLSTIKSERAKFLDEETAVDSNKETEIEYEDESKNKIETPIIKEILQYENEIDGIKYIYKVLRNKKSEELKEITNYILEENNYVAILGLPFKEESTMVVLRSRNLNIDLKEILDHKMSFLKDATGNMLKVEIKCRTRDLANVMERFFMEIKTRIGE